VIQRRRTHAARRGRQLRVFEVARDISLDFLEGLAYTPVVSWEIEFTDQARDWILSLDDDDYDAMAGVIDLLEQNGPMLGRPAVDRIEGSRHHNMKELRSSGQHLRALFCFDPRRTAIILLGGDKAGDWTGWYERNVPIADDLYDEYLTELKAEGLI
jgi:hypothetical protein